jgi:predicted transcriptional regulator
LSAANVTATNGFARNLLASLKSGVLLKGTVCSHSSYGPTQFTWIAVELPAVGERQLPVKSEHNLQIGQEVEIECVPNPHKPGHFMFRIAEDPASSAVS